MARPVKGKAELAARFGFLTLGIAALGMGDLFFSCSGMGMDPVLVFYSGVAAVLRIRLGSATLLISVLLLTVLLFLCRSRIGIGTAAVSLGLGPLVNLYLEFFSFSPSGWPGKILSALLAVLFYGLGMALYLHADLGEGPIDILLLFLLEKTSLPLPLFKVFFDAFFLAAGWLLGGAVGIGTIMAVLLSGPAIGMFQKGIERLSPLSKWQKEASR